MIGFEPVINPNLPSDKVLHIVVNGEYPQFIKELEKCGMYVLSTEACGDVLPALRCHADMLFCNLGNGEFLIEKSQNILKDKLGEIEFFTAYNDVELGKIYPEDIALNACIIGNKVICGKKGIHTAIKKNRDIIEANQGYAKCSVCVVDENSLITDDESIYEACIINGLDVLMVKKGCVKLKSFDYGFIGGCCGKIADDTIAFCGDLNTHDDADRIKSFLCERGVYPISLGKGDLTDIGSLIPVTQIKL